MFTAMGKQGETIVRTAGMIAGQQFLCDGIENCTIHVLDHCAQVTIDDAKRCEIIIGPCEDSVFVRDCEDCVVHAVCRQLRTRNCYRCKFFLYVLTDPIIESSHSCEIGEWHIAYPLLDKQFALANLDPLEPNLCHKVYDFTPEEFPDTTHWTAVVPIPKPRLIAGVGDAEPINPLPGATDAMAALLAETAIQSSMGLPLLVETDLSGQEGHEVLDRSPRSPRQAKKPSGLVVDSSVEDEAPEVESDVPEPALENAAILLGRGGLLVQTELPSDDSVHVAARSPREKKPSGLVVDSSVEDEAPEAESDVPEPALENAAFLDEDSVADSPALTVASVAASPAAAIPSGGSDAANTQSGGSNNNCGSTSCDAHSDDRDNISDSSDDITPDCEPAPDLRLVVGSKVRIKPAVQAQLACESAGLAWNAARKKRSDSEATLEAILDEGFCRLGWEEAVSGRVDKLRLKFPVAALVAGGAGGEIGRLEKEGVELEASIEYTNDEGMLTDTLDAVFQNAQLGLSLAGYGENGSVVPSADDPVAAVIVDDVRPESELVRRAGGDTFFLLSFSRCPLLKRNRVCWLSIAACAWAGGDGARSRAVQGSGKTCRWAVFPRYSCDGYARAAPNHALIQFASCCFSLRSGGQRSRGTAG